MRLLKPNETEPEEYFVRPKKSHEFSDHERAVILEMAQGAGRDVEHLSESELAKLIERYGNMRGYCTDPENYPPEVVHKFEGMYTVPAYLLFERFDKELLQSLRNNEEDSQ